MRFVLVCVAALALAGPATASGNALFGIQDDAWLAYGSGTLEGRLDRLNGLGVDVVRYTIEWNRVEPVEGRYDWAQSDAILRGLHAHGIAPVVTLNGTPRWANGGRAPNRAPRSARTFAAFARAAAERYGFVKRWLIWNEPNQRRWLRPTSPGTYTRLLLNPAYGAIHAAIPGAKVAGGVTAPRGNTGGVSPVAWIRGMRAANARLDAYAHNPYPLSPSETPTSGGCRHCETITMSTLGRLSYEVRRAWGAKRIWLTEFGYQTNPPDRWLGVSTRLQARYTAEAAQKAWTTPRVDLLIHYLVKDEPAVGRWQSGLYTAAGVAKPAANAFRLPLVQRSRSGLRTVVWGMVRPRAGTQTFRLQQFRGGRWQSVGSTRRTTARGSFAVAVRAGQGARLRIWSPRDHAYSPVLAVA